MKVIVLSEKEQKLECCKATNSKGYKYIVCLPDRGIHITFTEDRHGDECEEESGPYVSLFYEVPVPCDRASCQSERQITQTIELPQALINYIDSNPTEPFWDSL